MDLLVECPSAPGDGVASIGMQIRTLPIGGILPEGVPIRTSIGAALRQMPRLVSGESQGDRFGGLHVSGLVDPLILHHREPSGGFKPEESLKSLSYYKELKQH